jgi:hypothetical protein
MRLVIRLQLDDFFYREASALKDSDFLLVNRFGSFGNVNALRFDGKHDSAVRLQQQIRVVG